tara:strand:- start:77 stop:913 length:837 start_codon:yes stop_codon:yes gene_type:complete
MLEGLQTQDRRPIKPQPKGEWAAPGKTAAPLQPGDIVWVRETHGLYNPGNPETGLPNRDITEIIYPATDEVPDIGYDADDMPCEKSLPMRPSIHMPKPFCRLFLEVKSVRIEQIRNISEADCLAEGIELHVRDWLGEYGEDWEPQCWFTDDAGPSYCRTCAEAIADGREIDGGYSGASIETDDFERCDKCGKLLECSPLNLDYFLPDSDGQYIDGTLSAEEIAMAYNYAGSFGFPNGYTKEAFRVLWESIYPGSWDRNEWVWVYEFKRIGKPAGWPEN